MLSDLPVLLLLRFIDALTPAHQQACNNPVMLPWFMQNCMVSHWLCCQSKLKGDIKSFAQQGTLDSTNR